jgi:hypothetical protein
LAGKCGVSGGLVVRWITRRYRHLHGFARRGRGRAIFCPAAMITPVMLARHWD